MIKLRKWLHECLVQNYNLLAIALYTFHLLKSVGKDNVAG